MKLWIVATGCLVIAGIAVCAALPAQPGEELVGTWELAEKICDRSGNAALRRDYTSERSDMISVLSFKTPTEGTLEEVHLARGRSCTGKSEFQVEYLEEKRIKLTQHEMVWNGHSNRALANLGCIGNDRHVTTFLSYEYDEHTDTLSLIQSDRSRVCSSVISIFRRR